MPRIFVGNLPFDTREDDLRSRFAAFGHVTSVRLATDAANQSRGFAFVVMPSLDDADEAVSRLSGTEFGGRRLTVNTSIDKPRKSQPTVDHRSRSGAIAFFDSIMAD